MDNEQGFSGSDLNHLAYICDICGQNDLNNMEMKMHMATTHGDEATCLFCDLKGVTPEEMTIHINSVHFDDNLVMGENRNMELEQSCDVYTLMRKNDALSFCKACETKMSADELNIEAAGVEDSVDSGVSCNKCCRCGCTEEATVRRVEDIKLGAASSLLTFTDSTEQLINPDIQRLLEDQSNSTPETKMESNFLCPFCDFVTDDGNAIETHFTVDHSDQLLAGKANNESFPLYCPICGLIFHESSVLQLHANDHFREDLQTNGSAENMMNMHSKKPENEVQMIEYCQQQGGSWNVRADQRVLNCSIPAESLSTSEKVGKENCKSSKSVAYFPSSLDTDDRSSSTEGVIGKLLSHYNKSHDVKQFWLCSNVDHYSTGADRGWGCGYRNFQMLLSGLIKCSTYRAEVFQGVNTLPSLRKIQSLIEDAWRMGFDQTGSVQFQSTVLSTKKWIGATEVVTVLSSLQIRCSLVDFHTSTGSNGTHPLLFEWIKNYFQTPEPCKLPLYFQHQGHSRTIIGMEEHHDGSLKLLAFDPGVPHTTMKKYLQMEDAAPLLKCLRKSITDLKQKQYQIVSVHGIMNKSEMEDCKILKSTRIP